MNFEKEQERLTSLTIIEKRYSFLFEDVWFILIQYMYFEKFVVRNAVYLAEKSGEDWLNDKIVNYEWSPNVGIKETEYQINQWNDAKKQYHKSFITKNFGFMLFNLAFTALTGLLGLMTIPHCFRMIKQEKPKTKILYILTFVQILLQTTVPFLRAGLVILQVNEYTQVNAVDAFQNIQRCALVGFQVYFTFWSVICGQNIHIHIFVSDNVISIIHM